FTDLEQIVRVVDCCVVDQHVEAPELVDNISHQLLRSPRLGHVGADKDRTITYVSHHLLAALFRATRNSDGESRFSKLLRDHYPNSTRGSGNERNLKIGGFSHREDSSLLISSARSTADFLWWIRIVPVARRC